MTGEAPDAGTRGRPSEVYAALADPSRRQMIARLARGPATTGQLAELLPISRPAVSQHLKVLQGARLVATTVIGRHRWHELIPGTLLAAAQWAGEMVERHAEAPPLRPPG
jgi:DNA-binding transcriptional ArsR family regulator